MTDVPVLTEKTDFLVFGDDLKRAGTGCKDSDPWFRERGTSLRDVLRFGISAKFLLETGDGYAIRVVKMAMERRNGKEK